MISRSEIFARLDTNNDGRINGFEHDIFLESTPALGEGHDPSKPTGLHPVASQMPTASSDEDLAAGYDAAGAPRLPPGRRTFSQRA